MREPPPHQRFVHYSSGPVALRPVDHAGQTGRYKPPGFWFSCEGAGDGWREWCEAEGFDLDRLVYETEVHLLDEDRFLWLRTAADILSFSVDFEGRCQVEPIDWRAVMARYAGLIIAPYCWCWELRLNELCRWYYGWDCASGVAWDVSQIRLVSPEAAGVKVIRVEAGARP